MGQIEEVEGEARRLVEGGDVLPVAAGMEVSAGHWLVTGPEGSITFAIEGAPGRFVLGADSGLRVEDEVQVYLRSGQLEAAGGRLTVNFVGFQFVLDGKAQLSAGPGEALSFVVEEGQAVLRKADGQRFELGVGTHTLTEGELQSETPEAEPPPPLEPPAPAAYATSDSARAPVELAERVLVHAEGDPVALRLELPPRCGAAELSVGPVDGEAELTGAAPLSVWLPAGTSRITASCGRGERSFELTLQAPSPDPEAVPSVRFEEARVLGRAMRRAKVSVGGSPTRTDRKGRFELERSEEANWVRIQHPRLGHHLFVADLER